MVHGGGNGGDSWCTCEFEGEKYRARLSVFFQKIINILGNPYPRFGTIGEGLNKFRVKTSRSKRDKDKMSLVRIFIWWVMDQI